MIHEQINNLLSSERAEGPADSILLDEDYLSRFALAFRAIPDAVVLVDPERRIVLINPAFTELFGYTLDELRGRPTTIIYSSLEDYEEQGRIRFNLKAEEKLKPYEIKYRKKNGDVFPSETVGTVVIDEGGRQRGFLGIIRDISDRKALEKTLQETLSALEARVLQRTTALQETNERLLAEIESRRKTEEALRSSEEKFHSLYHSMGEGACLHEIIYDAGHAVDYRILAANSAFEKILGIPASQAVGSIGSQLFGTEEPPYLDIFVKVGETGKPESFETYFPPMARHFHISVFSPQFGQFATVFRDITERKKNEMKLEDALERLIEEKTKAKALLAAIGEGISIQDSEFRIQYQNKKHMEMTGDYVGRYCYEAYEKRQRVCEGCPVALCFEDGGIHTKERQVSHEGGTRFYEITASPLRDRNGNIIAGIEVARDITERRKNEAAIRKSEASLRSIMLAAPIGIGLVHERIFSWVNEAMARMTGYSEEELIGRSARILYPDDQEFLRVGQVKYQQFRYADVGEVDTVWVRKNGERIDVQLRSSPLDPNDLSLGVTFTALDITDRRKAIAEKINLEKQIQHVQKLESLGVLAGGIAHDFNNLLMAILGNADLALTRLLPEAPGRENIVAIEKASQRAADLCRQMLAYSGKGKFVLEILNLSEIVREMSHMLEISISKNVVIKYNFADPLPLILADPTQLRQVVMNLIVNASEAIGDKSGFVSITTGDMECDREYLNETSVDDDLPGGRYVYLEVADTGIGMSRETRHKLFDPFFSTKFTGRGLGMSAVLGIVRGHRGAIKVHSEVGKGTAITVLFPAQEGDIRSEVQYSGPEPKDQAWQGKGLILLVDDEKIVTTVGKQMLEMLGFSVITAADGREALERYKERRQDISCVILDLTMPHMDGDKAFRELRRMDPELRVIISSGYDEQEVTQHFAGAGLAGFIQKPYQMATLSAKLQEVLNNSRS